MKLIWTPAQLAMLAKVVDLNGFSAAARALGVSKAAVSRAVADLEKALGVRVLERTTRRVSLTDAGPPGVSARAPRGRGDRCRPRCHRAAACPRGAAAARGRRPDLRARAALAAGAPLPREVPQCRWRSRSMRSSWPPAPGTWPFARARRRMSSFVQRLLGAPPALLCATPAYLQQRGTPERPDDLRTHELLTPDAAEQPEFRLLLSKGAQRAEVPLSPKLAVDDPAVLHAATAAGLGIGLLPEFLCRQGLATGRLKVVLPEWTRTGGGGTVRAVSGGAGVGSARPAVRGFPGREHRPGARARPGDRAA